MQKPLHTPNKKVKGLRVYCSKCKGDITRGKCRETGKSVQSCRYIDQHTFKAVIYDNNGKRKTKNLDRDLATAIQQIKTFENEVKAGLHNKTEVKPKEEAKPYLLRDCLGRFSGWIRNEDTPIHLQRGRSEQHIQDIDRALLLFANCLKKKGYDLETLTIDQINDKMVGDIYQELEDRGFAGRTFNKYISTYSSFIAFYSEQYDFPLRNPFAKVKRRQVNSNPEAITKNEYEALLKQITPENGLRPCNSKTKPMRSVFKEWLKSGIQISLLTGARREEVTSLQYKDIIESEDGTACIKVEDFKVNRIQNRADNEKKYKYIPLTKDLRELLMELGYEKYKGSDTFILAPEIQTKRTKAMSDTLSRGFSHYFNQLNSGRKLTFKSLRKAYITNLSLFRGGSAKEISGHSSDAVIEKHYLDKQAIARASIGYEVFPKETERKEELATIREKSKEPKGKELER